MVKLFVEIAKEAALGAAAWPLREFFGKKQALSSYKEGDELVTEADKCAEQRIRDCIHHYYPDHSILGEEGGLEGKASSEYLWIVDPLDGTLNYSRGIHLYGVSIAVAWKKEIVAGVVYNPFTRELFMAEKGEGAYLHDELTFSKHRLTVSDTVDLSKALIYIGNLQKTRKHIEQLIDHVPSLRVNSSSSYEECLVASGRAEGFIKVNSKIWDYAAGFHIIEEAGGTVTNFDGSAWNIESTHMLASNGILHEEIRKNLIL
jgi:myo-inositol-1(or 4)-monophosphatase